MSEDQVFQACPIVSVQSIKDQHKEKGVFLIATQDGCPNCSQAKDIMKEECSSKPVMELPTAHCPSIAEELKIKQVPTIFYYKNGEEKARLEADGSITWRDFRERVRALDKEQ
jgi:hypothetical protein